jgi:hypothetical protein
MGGVMAIVETTHLLTEPHSTKVVYLRNPDALDYGYSTVGAWVIVANFKNFLGVTDWVRRHVNLGVISEAFLDLGDENRDVTETYSLLLLTKGYVNREDLAMMMRDFQKLGLVDDVLYEDRGPKRGRHANTPRRRIVAPNPFAAMTEHLYGTGKERKIGTIEP